jgi:hypothetical protein
MQVLSLSVASHARQVKGDDPDTKGHPGLPGWGWGVELTTSSRKTYLLRNFNQRLGMGINGKMLGGGGLKRPRSRLGCSVIGGGGGE